MSRRYLQTSSRDRSALATPDFHSAFFLPLERDHRCRFPLRTSGPVAPAHFGRDCSESGTIGTRRLFGVLVVRLQMELRDREQLSVHHEISPDRPRETIVRETAEPARLPPSSPHNPTSPGSRTGSAGRIQHHNCLRYRIGNPPELLFVLAQFLLRLFENVNVGTGSVPPQKLTMLVTKRLHSNQKPSIDTIVTTKPGLYLARLAGRQQLSPLLHHCQHVLQVERGLPVPTG